MRLLPLAAALVALTGCGAQPAVTSPAAAVVDSLYRVRQPFQGNGAPTRADLAAMRPWLSTELATLLQQADSIRSAESAAHPDEKPAFAEGDLFSSLFEGPEMFATRDNEVAGSAESGYRIPVHFTYTGQGTAQKWSDTVLVISENGKLVVSDVRYGGTWGFANKGSLLTSLHFTMVPQAPAESLRGAP